MGEFGELKGGIPSNYQCTFLTAFTMRKRRRKRRKKRTWREKRILASYLVKFLPILDSSMLE